MQLAKSRSMKADNGVIHNLQVSCNGSVDLTKHHQEKHRVGSFVPVGGGSPGRKTSDPLPPISLLEEERFFNWLLTRDKSRGFSSRAYYRAAGRVPFEWEITPGKPKNTSEPGCLPALSPPPYLHSHPFPLHQSCERPRFRNLIHLIGRNARSLWSNGWGRGAGFYARERISVTPEYRWCTVGAEKDQLRWPERGRGGCFPVALKNIFAWTKGRESR